MIRFATSCWRADDVRAVVVELALHARDRRRQRVLGQGGRGLVAAADREERRAVRRGRVRLDERDDGLRDEPGRLAAHVVRDAREELVRVVVADQLAGDGVDAAVGVDDDRRRRPVGAPHLRVLAVVADVPETAQGVQALDARLAEVLGRLDPRVAPVLGLDLLVARVHARPDGAEQELGEVGAAVGLLEKRLIAPGDVGLQDALGPPEVSVGAVHVSRVSLSPLTEA
jgi:hypothetical protein